SFVPASLDSARARVIICVKRRFFDRNLAFHSAKWDARRARREWGNTDGDQRENAPGRASRGAEISGSGGRADDAPGGRGGARARRRAGDLGRLFAGAPPDGVQRARILPLPLL